MASVENSHRLRSKKDFSFLRLKGYVVRTENFFLKLVESPDQTIRYAFSVRKKFGNAVYRNRIRRILRESLKQFTPKFEKNVWMHFSYTGSSENFIRKNLRKELEEVLVKSGIGNFANL